MRTATLGSFILMTDFSFLIKKSIIESHLIRFRPRVEGMSVSPIEIVRLGRFGKEYVRWSISKGWRQPI